MTCPSERIFAPERRHCLRNVVSLTLGANRLRRCSSSFIQAKKNCLRRQVSKMVGERGLRAPAGRALRAVAFATLSRCARRNPPSEVLILFYSGEKKPVFADRFLKYGRRERIRTSDPLVPNQLRYQAALLADFFILFCLVRREGLEPSRPLRH